MLGPFLNTLTHLWGSLLLKLQMMRHFWKLTPLQVFLTTCDHSFNWLLLWTISIVSSSPPFLLGKINFQSNAVWGKLNISPYLGGDHKNQRQSFTLEVWVNCLDSIFFDSQCIFQYIITLKIPQLMGCTGLIANSIKIKVKYTPNL